MIGRSSGRYLLAYVGHQSHESSSLDRLAHRVLAGCRATGFAAGNDTPVSIDQLGQQLHILVVNVHWTRTLAIYEQRILFLDLHLHPRAFARNSLTIGGTTAKGSLKVRHVICGKLESNRGRGNSFPLKKTSRVADLIVASASLQ